MALQAKPAHQEAKEMLTTKVRTTIIALLATLSFTAASVIPGVSQASKNTGAYKKSAEAQKKKQELCLASQQTWLDALEGYEAAEVGSKRAMELAEIADNMRALGKLEGCGGAARCVPPPQAPHPLGGGRVAQPSHRLEQLLRRRGIDDEAGVADTGGRPSVPGSDRGDAGRGGFDVHPARRLGQGGQHEDGGPPVELRQAR